MDEEMEDNTAVEFTFTAVEIDLDYEFEAARFFDFSREESVAEASEAERWFDSAQTYPPSPFAAKLIPREDLLGNVNVSPKSKGSEEMECGSDMGQPAEDSIMVMRNADCDGKEEGSLNLKTFNIQEFHNQPHLPTGLTLNDGTRNENFKFKTKSSLKPSFPRTSTLMKPTASQLAKQNQPHRVVDSRFQKLESNNSAGIESQPAKRQKLEGGQLHKVPDSKPQANFVHKASKREGTSDGHLTHGRLRITIPREPELETAHRARRIRPKVNNDREHVAPNASAFKALPLNRKIFEAPSVVVPKRTIPQLPEFREFHLKTSERAMQHSTAVSSVSSFPSKVQQKTSLLSAADCANGESKRRNLDTSRSGPKEGCETMHKFKALPLNKKILLSKGDMGVFRNSKKETTVPMEFNFQTEKRVQPPLPIELFNKLSLTSELQLDPGSQLKQPHPTSILLQGSKENRLCSFQQENEIKLLVAEKLTRFGTKHVHFSGDKGIAEVGAFSRMNRSLGIH